jgi:hypothetical protein
MTDAVNPLGLVSSGRNKPRKAQLMTNLSNPINLHQPGEYLIELQGRLDARWSDSFGGMAMTTQAALAGFTITTLQGVVADQSALHGILNRIRDLGLPLLKVECLSTTEISP